jgi:hypothetical protein
MLDCGFGLLKFTQLSQAGMFVTFFYLEMIKIILHPIFHPYLYSGWVNLPVELVDLQQGWMGDGMENLPLSISHCCVPIYLFGCFLHEKCLEHSNAICDSAIVNNNIVDVINTPLWSRLL